MEESSSGEVLPAIDTGMVKRLNGYFDCGFVLPDPITSGDEWLLQALTEAVYQLLQHRPEQLAQALYKVDVKEVLVTEAFRLTDARSIAQRLAQLVIDRESQKAAFRKRFSGPPQP